MATYFFSSFTQGQAQAFNAATDSIFFNTPEKGADFRVAINTLLGTYHVTTTSTGKAFDFGPGVLGATFTLADGSKVLIGTNGADNLTGTETDDALFGGDGNDTLLGRNGDDVLNGGPGQDILDGSNGSNLFIFEPGHSLVAAPDLINWTTTNTLEFTGLAGKAGKYEEATRATLADATAFANDEIAAGRADYVAVQVGVDVFVFADDRDNDGAADALVRVGDTDLSKISAANIKGAVDAQPPPAPPAPPPQPGGGGPIVEPSPQLPAIFDKGHSGASVFVTGSADGLDFNALANLPLVDASSDRIAFQSPTIIFELHGSFVYANDDLVGGTIRTQLLIQSGPGAFSVSITDIAIPVPAYLGWANAGDTASMTNAIYGGNDYFIGSSSADVMRGLGGNDTIEARGGNDTIFGGLGNDAILSGNGRGDSSYLRGEEGDDRIQGGGGFDDINGNQGDDTISGDQGDDWVVGGKDNDLQFGDDGNDIVWGNLGNDTLEGGAGNDQVRGGQGDDLLFGDGGADYLSGDRGADTIVGGAGADIFHSFSGAGIDRVLDFSVGDGDRVMLDPGTTYTVNQVGADTVIDLGGGDQVILVGVQMSTLPPGTIFLG